MWARDDRGVLRYLARKRSADDLKES